MRSFPCSSAATYLPACVSTKENQRERYSEDIEIAAIVKKNGWTQTEAARRCGITQPRTNDLLRGRVSRYSLDALVNIATAIGRRVHVERELA